MREKLKGNGQRPVKGEIVQGWTLALSTVVRAKMKGDFWGGPGASGGF